MVSKWALLVTDGILDKEDLHSQVYRDMPKETCGTRGRPVKHHRWHRGSAPGDIFFCNFCTDDLGAYLNESSTQRKAIQKKESSVPSGALLYLLGMQSRGCLQYYLERGEASCPSGAILISSEIDPQHYGIDPQSYRSPDL